jgi:hypothetical protein
MSDAGRKDGEERELGQADRANPSAERGGTVRDFDTGERERTAVLESGRPPLRPASPARSLQKPSQPVAKPEGTSGFNKTMGAIRTVLPLVQRVLPLLDGNVALAVANLLVPRQQGPAVDLKPIEGALTRMRTEHLELGGKLDEQASSLKRIGDQLDLVKESTERHSLEQKEVTDDLHRLQKKVTVFAWTGLILLAVSIGVNVVLFLRVEHIWR